jgi:hypothetical protein
MSESITGLGFLWIGFIVFTFLLPFVVFGIRNQVGKMNKKMDTIIELLGNSMTDEQTMKKQEHNYKLEMSSWGTDKQIKICKKCGRKNKSEEHSCTQCGIAFF